MKNLAIRTMMATFMAVGIPVLALAEDGHACNAAVLRGTYVFAATGFTTNAAALVVPKAIVELLTFKGDGVVEAPAATISVNGFIVRPAPSLGTYAVAEDCTGTVAFDDPPFPAFDIVAAPGGGELWMIQTKPAGNVFAGSAKRTAPGSRDGIPR